MTSILPPRFGAWTSFRKEWSIDDIAGLTEEKVAPALQALERLWPRYIDEMLAAPVRGPSIAIKAIHAGLVLQATESLRGVGAVIERLANEANEPAAGLAELEAAVLLMTCGLEPDFVPPTHTKTPDLVVHRDEVRTYFEIKCLRRADHHQHAMTEIMQCVATLAEATQCSVTLPLDLPPDTRAARQLGAARQQLVRGECNVVMLNVTKVIRGAREWPSDVGKFFQPNRNTRFSAVILWSTDYFVGDPTLRFTWDLIPNPHALVPLSNSIREALRRPQS